MNTAMKNIRLPDQLQSKIMGYFKYTYQTLNSQMELEDFFRMVSPSIKLKVTRHIFAIEMLSNPLFNGD